MFDPYKTPTQGADMAKMSRTQRAAILEAHTSGASALGTFSQFVRVASIRAMARSGWALGHSTFTGCVTTAGLIAAGVDMGAIEDEALAEHKMREAAAERATPAYRRLRAAVIEGKSYRAALDILHREAILENGRRARQKHPLAFGGRLGDLLDELLAVPPLATEQAHAGALGMNVVAAPLPAVDTWARS